MERICDRVALLHGGKIAAGGTLAEIKALHGHESLLLEFLSEADLQRFKGKELVFRIMAILRRSYKEENPLVRLQNSEIDFDRAEVIKNGKHIPLTAKEHDILAALYRNAGRIVTIDALCEAAWGDNPFGYEKRP